MYGPNLGEQTTCVLHHTHIFVYIWRNAAKHRVKNVVCTSIRPSAHVVVILGEFFDSVALSNPPGLLSSDIDKTVRKCARVYMCVCVFPTY